MKTSFILKTFHFALVLPVVWSISAFAQGTAFVYQGQLNDGAGPVSGIYDLRFALYDAASNGAQLGVTTNTATSVSNGLFTVTLDFANQFPGADRWLEISVRTNVSGAFTTLTPRQKLAAAPYAVMAGNMSGLLSATQISGAIPDANYSTNVALRSGSNTFADIMTITNTANGFGELRIDAPNTKLRLASQLDGAYIQSGTSWQSGSTNNLYFSGMFGTPNYLTIRSNGDLSVQGDVSANSFIGRGTLRWQTAVGTAVQAQPNLGYLVTNALTTVVSLPATPIVGDVVRVSSDGVGAWRIAQNTNQAVLLGSLPLMPTNWTPREFGATNCYEVACSADGNRRLIAYTKMPAPILSTSGPDCLGSGDGGITWGLGGGPGNGASDPTSVACSADGVIVVIAARTPALGQTKVTLSTDSLSSWSQPPIRSNIDNTFPCAAVSADGTHIAVIDTGRISVSTNYGQTWRSSANLSFIAPESTLAMSADGLFIAAACNSGMYCSTNGGVTWQPRGGLSSVVGLACSADGRRLIAVNQNFSRLYTSTDYGINWVLRPISNAWSAVASSTDGIRLVAVANPGRIYLSGDGGASWFPCESSRRWTSVACSADGTKILACASGDGHVYTSFDAFTSFLNASPPSTSPGTAGGLSGSPGAAVELQYVGSGHFITLSHEGAILGF